MGFSTYLTAVSDQAGRASSSTGVGLVLTAGDYGQGMTDADADLLRKYAAYMGPVVAASRTLLDQAKPVPLCAVCPSAQWYRIEDEKGAAHLECFCTAFRGVMYDYRKRAVTACDGHTDAIECEKAQTEHR